MPIFKSGIQKSIYNQFYSDAVINEGNVGLFQVHKTTFEPAHKENEIPLELRYPDDDNLKVSNGKPFNANLYWRETLHPNLANPEILTVPIIQKIRNIIKN